MKKMLSIALVAGLVLAASNQNFDFSKKDYYYLANAGIFYFNSSESKSVGLNLKSYLLSKRLDLDNKNILSTLFSNIYLSKKYKFFGVGAGIFTNQVFDFKLKESLFGVFSYPFYKKVDDSTSVGLGIKYHLGDKFSSFEVGFEKDFDFKRNNNTFFIELNKPINNIILSFRIEKFKDNFQALYSINYNF